jgi:hypothetical protein
MCAEVKAVSVQKGRARTLGMLAMRSAIEEGTISVSSRPTFRAWTIQRAACWEVFQKRGILWGDGRRACHQFRPAYRWLIEQMRGRVHGYQGGFPVWFWYSPKPDLRHSAHLSGGEHGIRIEVELPRERVLLLDYGTWHCVLNRWHLSRSWRESREWDRKTRGFDQFKELLPSKLEAEMQATWERVFDLDMLTRSRLWGPIDVIQGVTEYVSLDEVRRVTEFVAR